MSDARSLPNKSLDRVKRDFEIRVALILGFMGGALAGASMDFWYVGMLGAVAVCFTFAAAIVEGYYAARREDR